jgi:hypothetical protein
MTWLERKPFNCSGILRSLAIPMRYDVAVDFGVPNSGP